MTRTIATLFVGTAPENLVLSARSLLDRTDLDVIVGVLYPVFAEPFESLSARITVRPVGSVSELVNRVHAEHDAHVVAVNDAVELPPDPFGTALEWIDGDLRVATVSFLCNDADFLSFPVRNLPQGRPLDGFDEVSITRRLRSLSPPPQRAPIMFATGPVVVISGPALDTIGGLEAPHSARFDVAIADFSCRARAKGFVDLADTSTFVTRPSDAAIAPVGDSITTDDRGWLLHRHRSMVGFVDHERNHGDSPFAMAHQVARVKVTGLRVLVDGSCFGPVEVGTQVATLHTIAALAASSEVAWVSVVLPGALPAYGAAVLTGPKVTAAAPPNGDLAHFGPQDIAFRPYQPVPGWNAAAWKAAGVRLVVSLLDTIAFHNGGYFADTATWLAYRDNIASTARLADAIVVISQDVVGQLLLHALPVESDRLRAIPLGTEHLGRNDAVAYPGELEARGFMAGEFALVLGANYTHKNREIALAAHEELRKRGFDLTLVMAGVSVPHGTTRLAENARGSHAGHVIVIPELPASQRNWLLRHASLVWYPTSAEGFGLVPFEAAHFGTPTVAVGFGPLAELLGDPHPPSGADVPVLAPGWKPHALADVAERLLSDPDLARRHTEAVLRLGARYTWTATASALTALFREALARPKK